MCVSVCVGTSWSCGPWRWRRLSTARLSRTLNLLHLLKPGSLSSLGATNCTNKGTYIVFWIYLEWCMHSYTLQKMQEMHIDYTCISSIIDIQRFDNRKQARISAITGHHTQTNTSTQQDVGWGSSRFRRALFEKTRPWLLFLVHLLKAERHQELWRN